MDPASSSHRAGADAPGAAPLPDPARLADALLRWRATKGRALAGRENRDPWCVLVLEVISQQTQIERALPATARFCARYPNPGTLAAASPADVLRAWDGLGYNRRALALRAAAQIITRTHGGGLPENLAALRELPGIGPYTARAVAARALGQAVMPLDVNVRRVLSRVLGDAAPATLERAGDAIARAAAADRRELADQLRAVSRAAGPQGSGPRKRIAEAIPAETVKPAPSLGPGHVADALMDLATLVCRRRDPACAACPLQRWCRWRLSPAADQSPAVPAPRRRDSPPLPFRATRRWLRGQLLRELRMAPEGTWTRLQGARGEHDAAAVQATLRRLAAEGFVELDGVGGARLAEG